MCVCVCVCVCVRVCVCVLVREGNNWYALRIVRATAAMRARMHAYGMHTHAYANIIICTRTDASVWHANAHALPMVHVTAANAS